MKHSEPSQNQTNSVHNQEADYYLDDNGMTVFTSDFLLRRGYCCGNGCRHCPYDYQQVAEPMRSELLNNQKKTP